MPAVTRGEEIIEACEATAASLERLKYGPFGPADISQVVVPLAIQVELFLKSAVFPAASSRKGFKDLVEKLQAEGVGSSHITNLHSLRELYNAMKHEPNADLGLASSLSIVRNARDALSAVNAQRLGLTGVPLTKVIRYHLWVGFWDSYTGGFTEVAIMLPGTHWTGVSSVDTLYIDISAWESLKVTLNAHPRFHLGEAEFSPATWRSFWGDGDFLNAGVWEGDYAELVSLLAIHAHREIEDKLLPGLARKDNYVSIGTSIISAALDLMHAAASDALIVDLERQVLERADSEYALQPSDTVRQAAGQVCAVLRNVPFPKWKLLAGPFLALRRERPEHEMKSAPGPLDLVLEDGSLVLRYSDGISISVMEMK